MTLPNNDSSQKRDETENIRLENVIQQALKEAREAKVDWRAGTLDIEERIPDLASSVERLARMFEVAVRQRDVFRKKYFAYAKPVMPTPSMIIEENDAELMRIWNEGAG